MQHHRGAWKVGFLVVLSFMSYVQAETRTKEPKVGRAGVNTGGNPDQIADLNTVPPASSGISPATDGQVAGGTNDSCQARQAIAGTGVFAFDNRNATTDGPEPQVCGAFEPQIENDVWFCWTAPAQACGGVYSVSTCGRTTIDTKIAVYNGCTCPTNDSTLINCRDDDCSLQTRVTFNAVPSQTYLIRVGNYPGETGDNATFSIQCELPLPCSEPTTHCQQANQLDAINSERSQFTTADGFTPAQSGNINDACWWGMYLTDVEPFQNCAPSGADSFRIRYLNDNDGVPGTQIASFSQQAGNLTVDPRATTGLLISPSFQEYEYHASHANVPVVAGNCYWIEISNEVNGCRWYWEAATFNDGRTIQGAPPDGYQLQDVRVGDMAFCTSLTLSLETENCLPPPPSNDSCGSAQAISGTGTFLLDTAAATSSGPDNAACLFQNEDGIGRDAWFRWTSTCSGDVLVRTCDNSTVDTKLAVYSGTTCPNAASNPVACNDDLCGSQGFQSMVKFSATPSQQFLIRAGSYPGQPGGVMGIVISCGAPNNASCGVAGDNTTCCVENGPTLTPGCGVESCCELVCVCDPYCCNIDWDVDCAGFGVGGNGCGAAALCQCGCGSPFVGDCCTEHIDQQPSCSNDACCDAVCACDPYCCGMDEPDHAGWWDDKCAGDGFVMVCQGTTQTCTTSAECAPGVSCVGCGARSLCGNLCSGSTCSGVNDSATRKCPIEVRRPHAQNNTASDYADQKSIQITFAADCNVSAMTPSDFTIDCVPAGAPCPSITTVGSAGQVVTVNLNSRIADGKWTCVTHTATGDKVCRGSLPGDVNNSFVTSGTDIIRLVDNLNNFGPALPLVRCDLDRSGVCIAQDIITMVDLLNGNGYAPWNGANLGQYACPARTCGDGFCDPGENVTNCDPDCN